MRSGQSTSILDAIGNTPMIEVEGIYCKLEYLNPSGSIKARVAKYMVERAERGEVRLEAITPRVTSLPPTVARCVIHVGPEPWRWGSGSLTLRGGGGS